MKAKRSIVRADIIRPLLTASIVLAITLTLTTSCGNHTFDEIFGLESSSSEQADNSSSSSKPSSSSSLGQSSNSEQHSGIIVGPLLQTKWAQRSPYNDLFPMVDGSRKVTDCATTALVQIMKFHKYPPRGKGESDLVGPGDIPVPLTSLDVAYDWDNMLNEYTSRNPGTEQQRLAVATLFYHFGLARSIGLSGSTHKALVNNFGYDKSLQRLERKYYSNAEWEAIIRKQLDLGLPVYAVIRNGDHAVVIDGYDNAGKFHLNWGWSGSSDGWYSVNELSMTAIHINIKPDAGSIGSNEMGLKEFTASKETIFQDEAFTVKANIRSAGSFPGGQAGVALVDNSGKIVEIIGTRSYVALNVGYTLLSTINCSIPYSINAGKYNLRYVTKMNGETDWKIVERSLPSVPKSIPITVTEAGTKGGGYSLSLRRFTPDKTTASQNEEFTVDHSLSDVSSTSFPAVTSGVALIDDNNDIVEYLKKTLLQYFSLLD